MNFADLLRANPIRTSLSFEDNLISLEYVYLKNGELHSVSKELRDCSLAVSYEKFEADQKFETKVFVDNGEDKHGIYISVLFFENKELLGFIKKGCYGDESEAYVFNSELLDQAYGYLKSISEKEGDWILESKPACEWAIPEKIHGTAISGLFDPQFVAKYKKEDEVWAWVPEHPFNRKDNFVLVKVTIGSVKPHSPTQTYHGFQINRSWIQNGKHPCEKLVFCEGGWQGVVLDESMILGLSKDLEGDTLIEEHSFYKKVDANGELPASYAFSMADIQTFFKQKGNLQ